MINFRKAKYIKSTPDLANAPEKKFNEVLFVGKSNVGKSSLINAICDNKNLAKVSSRPGATKYLNYFLIDDKYYFVDAPGYGFVLDNKGNFNDMMENIFKSNKLRGVIFILDSRRELSIDDKVFYNSLIDRNLPFFIVLSKADKLNQSERVKIIKEVKKYFSVVKEDEMILFSIKDKNNIKKLKDKIEYLLKY